MKKLALYLILLCFISCQKKQDLHDYYFEHKVILNNSEKKRIEKLVGTWVCIDTFNRDRSSLGTAIRIYLDGTIESNNGYTYPLRNCESQILLEDDIIVYGLDYYKKVSSSTADDIPITMIPEEKNKSDREQSSNSATSRSEKDQQQIDFYFDRLATLRAEYVHAVRAGYPDSEQKRISERADFIYQELSKMNLTSAERNKMNTLYNSEFEF